MSALVLGCYDEQALMRLFCEEGIVAEIRGKGFENVRVQATTDTAIPHVRMQAEKQGTTHLLLDACLTDAIIAPEFFLELKVYEIAVEFVQFRPQPVAVVIEAELISGYEVAAHYHRPPLSSQQR